MSVILDIINGLNVGMNALILTNIFPSVSIPRALWACIITLLLLFISGIICNEAKNTYAAPFGIPVLCKDTIKSLIFVVSNTNNNVVKNDKIIAVIFSAFSSPPSVRFKNFHCHMVAPSGTKNAWIKNIKEKKTIDTESTFLKYDQNFPSTKANNDIVGSTTK